MTASHDSMSTGGGIISSLLPHTITGGDKMRWLSLLLWSVVAVYGARSPGRSLAARLALSAGLIVSMLCQLRLLWLDDQLTLSTGLPLHLCGLMGVLSVPMLWFRLNSLYHFSLLLGAPCAFLTLCFPAVIGTSHPQLMALSFNRLHGLIVCSALFQYAQQKPPPTQARTSLLMGSGYLLLIAVFNRIYHTNYLFLAQAPAATPLDILFARGGSFYLCSLVMLAMVIMRLMLELWTHARWLRLTIEGSKSICTRYSRCT